MIATIFLPLSFLTGFFGQNFGWMVGEASSCQAFVLIGIGLEVLMDLGWIRTYGSRARMAVQISFASQGGSGTQVPDLSIEVDDLDAALRKIRAAGLPIEYGPAEEPWGVRRFYVRDPFGKLVNILQHAR